MTGPAERKRWRIRRPSPALVVALLALFVALSGTAVAAGVVPLAKRALVADTRQELAEARRPHRGAGRLARAAAQRLLQDGAPGRSPRATRADFKATCDAGEHVVSGGYDNPDGNALAADTHPSADGLSWVIYLQNLSPSDDTAGNVYAVCLR